MRYVLVTSILVLKGCPLRLATHPLQSDSERRDLSPPQRHRFRSLQKNIIRSVHVLNRRVLIHVSRTENAPRDLVWKPGVG